VIDVKRSPIKFFRASPTYVLAANALKSYMFYIMFRVFIFADSISNKTMMPDIFEHLAFLNDLSIFRDIES
jgi:hypothetical protein